MLTKQSGNTPPGLLHRYALRNDGKGKALPGRNMDVTKSPAYGIFPLPAKAKTILSKAKTILSKVKTILI
jgi:hypothetical protein